MESMIPDREAVGGFFSDESYNSELVFCTSAKQQASILVWKVPLYFHRCLFSW